MTSSFSEKKSPAASVSHAGLVNAFPRRRNTSFRRSAAGHTAASGGGSAGASDQPSTGLPSGPRQWIAYGSSRHGATDPNPS